jgi:hypothetical protein
LSSDILVLSSAFFVAHPADSPAIRIVAHKTTHARLIEPLLFLVVFDP